MTDTPRETILADIRNRLAKTTPMNHPLLKLSSAFADIKWLLAECDTLRAQLADARADVVRMAASKIGDRCEHHTFALKVLESLTTRECPICWKACAEQAEAQLAAREGEIATERTRFAHYSDQFTALAVELEVRADWVGGHLRYRVLAELRGAAEQFKRYAAGQLSPSNWRHRADVAESRVTALEAEIATLTAERNNR